MMAIIKPDFPDFKLPARELWTYPVFLIISVIFSLVFFDTDEGLLIVLDTEDVEYPDFLAISKILIFFFTYLQINSFLMFTMFN